uniref:Uncharacterized protein n=2 Tax=Nothobranchius TaxID=28779 RepID=A0A1A8UX85_NOTFU
MSSLIRSRSSSALLLFLPDEESGFLPPLSLSSVSPTAALGPGVSSGMEAIRTGGIVEGLCPNTSSMGTNQGQVSAVGFPLTPSPDPGYLQSYRQRELELQGFIVI